MRFKSQTATEYLIILAIVIIIAAITINVISNTSLLGGGLNEKTARLTLASRTIAITDYAISDYDTTLVFQNNHKNTIIITDILLNNQPCLFFYNTNNRLSPGQDKKIICQTVYELSDSDISYPIEINYTDAKTGALYSQTDDVLIATVSAKYLNTVQSNQYWNDSIKGCFDASISEIPICTCIDLNKTRNNLDSNYSLQNSIDFNRCNSLFEADFISNFGWTSIGSSGTPFTGIFDGNEFIIANLRDTNISDNSAGLFGGMSGSDTIIKNIGIYNYSIEGTYSLGGLVGSVSGSQIINSFSKGTIIATTQDSGGLIGTITGTGSVSNSFSIFSISSSGNRMGGLVGYLNGNGAISNSYAKGSITSNSNTIGGLTGGAWYGASNAQVINSYSDAIVIADNKVGGLIGYFNGLVENSYAIGTTLGNNSPGGLVGSAPFGSFQINNLYWINQTDDAYLCVGDDNSFDGNGCTTVSSKKDIPLK